MRIAIIAVATLVGSTALADVTYLRTNKDQVLTAGQKTGLSNWITNNWPGFAPASLNKLGCYQGRTDGALNGTYGCVGYDERTMTGAQHAQLILDGKAGAFVSRDGSNVTTLDKKGPVAVTGSALTSLEGMLSAACNVPNMTVFTGFTCDRIPGNGVRCSCDWEHTGTDEEYATDFESGHVIGVISVP